MTQPVAERLEAAALLCERQNAQLTELRRAVLELVMQADGPVTAYQLLDRLRQTRKGAVPPTIYRALGFLIEHKLIHKIERLNAFICCTEGEHAHASQFLICRRCGTVAEIDDHAVSAALDRAARVQDFRPSHAVVEIEGVCGGCEGVRPGAPPLDPVKGLPLKSLT